MKAGTHDRDSFSGELNCC